jgi:hypothetical protein
MVSCYIICTCLFLILFVWNVLLHSWCVNYVCMYAYCVLLIFPSIESNDECAEEGEIFEYQEEEDQGQATQGKPSTCCIPESYYFTLHCFTTVFLIMHCFLYCSYSLCSNSWRLNSTSRLDIIHRDDTPCDLLNTPSY